MYMGGRHNIVAVLKMCTWKTHIFSCNLIWAFSYKALTKEEMWVLVKLERKKLNVLVYTCPTFHSYSIYQSFGIMRTASLFIGILKTGLHLGLHSAYTTPRIYKHHLQKNTHRHIVLFISLYVYKIIYRM